MVRIPIKWNGGIPMETINTKKSSRYFKEVAVRLQQAGFTVLPADNDLLPISKDGRILCRIARDSSVRYRSQEVDTPERNLACIQVSDIAAMTVEYMKLFDKAPTLKAEGLSENYQLLADFNGAVLAGKSSEYGVQFVTWEWSYDQTGLWQGHYYGNNYEGAKQDFAVRAGLIQKCQLFSDEQLAEIYRCLHETLESGYPIPTERQNLLEGAAKQIECAVPNLEELVNQSNREELEVAEEPWQGMTQQF